MNPLTNPSPEAMLSIDNELLMDNLNQLFNKIAVLKTEAYSPSVVIKFADEVKANLENALRCLASKQTIENKLYRDEIGQYKKAIDLLQDQVREVLALLKKSVAKNCN